MNARKAQICPTCKKTFSVTDSFPFCSKRCKLLDLEGWMSERYKVSSPAILDEESVTTTTENDENDT